MRYAFPFLLLLLCQTTAVSAQGFGPKPDAKTRAELLSARELAWRAWFTNDRAAFTRIVPDELLAIGWDGGEWADRTQSMANMQKFAASGQTLTALEFPRTEFQRYGDVVIMYSTFRIAMKGKDDNVVETVGRGTEVFVLRNGRWVHTSWHLDKVASL
ncbi:MAG: nuclear transport factor 2 family protein [Gemmatimonadaceae bacterium]